MRWRRRRRKRSVVGNLRLKGALFILVAAISLEGCGVKADHATKNESSHVRLLTSLYGMASSKLGHTPGNAEEFKQIIPKLGLSLEKLKVNSVDDLFVSERDGQPLVVTYGPPSATSDVVVHEQTGVNGKRQVGHKI